MADSKTAAIAIVVAQCSARHLVPDNLSTMRRGLAGQLERLREIDPARPIGLPNPPSPQKNQRFRVLRFLGGA